MTGAGAEESTPDLMAELRARTEEALGASVGGAATGEASSEPTVQVPFVLLRRLVTTLSEARVALAERHPQSEGAGQGEAPAARDVEMARLVVLNMALNGAPRSEAEQYLTRNFALGDPAAIVADAYERVPEILSPPPASGPGSDGAAVDHDRQAP